MDNKLKNILTKKEIIVISITRGQIKLTLVDAGENKIIKETKKEWDPTNIEETRKVITELASSMEERKVRLLLGEDISYVLELPYSEDITRKEILSEISEKIPEQLDEYSWDYKIEEKEGEEKIIAFAPVKNVYENFVKPLLETQIEVEAVEPEQIAQNRNENPIIGLALKKDIKGKDEKILNLKTREPVEKKEPEQKGEKPKGDINLKEKILKNKKNIILVAVSVILFLGAGGILAFYFLSSRRERALVQQPPVESQAETEKESITDPAKVNLLIINTLESSEETENVKEILEAERFVEISTQETDEPVEEVTLVQKKENVDQKIAETIERALNSEYEIMLDENPLEESAENDVILIIGQRID